MKRYCTEQKMRTSVLGHFHLKLAIFPLGIRKLIFEELNFERKNIEMLKYSWNSQVIFSSLIS